jgi:DNA-binding transcriptional ArsR family regulator
MERRRDIFQAMADPTRRAIIGLLVSQTMTPNTLAEKFETSRQAVSKHIRILQECGIVADKHLGREIYYRINPKSLRAVDDWIKPFRAMWESRFDNLDNYLARAQKEKPE